MPHGDLSGILELYGQAVPKQFFEQLHRDLGLPERQRVFTLPLLVWLMVSQRLDTEGNALDGSTASGATTAADAVIGSQAHPRNDGELSHWSL